MRGILFLLTSTLLVFGLNAQSNGYQVTIDLTQVDNDRLPVSIIVPPSEEPFSEYHMAKVVPGTYSISDFGRFITDFSAEDKDGNELAVEKLSTNKWKIENGGKLYQISYHAHDSWDDFKEYGDNVIFEPGGTSIDEERNVYVINTFGFVGYIDGQQFKPYKLKINHSEDLYGATALNKQEVSPTEDIYFAQDFNFLADGPIMYSLPDTVTKEIAGAEILVSVYSPNDLLSANQVMDNIYDLMVAQSKYLGGELPVDKYAYLIYLHDEPSFSGSMGALEHSYSSLYSLPEAAPERLAQTVRDVAAHEFFHIVTPLNIHSEEIGQFNYIEPEMSKHLWLYEGVTEYSSMHVQVKYNLYEVDSFLEEIQEKLRVADRFEDVSFTEMSEKILEEEYEPMYVNVYYKGALIAMCLDLYIIKYSNGEKDLQWLMRELAKKYGKQQSFNDDELFEVIESLTYPEVGQFLKKHVSGSEPLPIEKVMSWAGLEYIPNKVVSEITLGSMGLGLSENQEIVVTDIENTNEFGQDLGVQEGDILYSLQGETIDLTSVQDIINEFKTNTDPGEKVILVVQREKKGKLKKKKLKAKAMLIEKSEKHFLEFVEEPSDEQYKVLRAWITAG